MSWLFSKAMMDACENSPSSPGLVAEYSADTCLDGAPSAQLNVMPTQHKFWRNDKTMEFSNLSRFGLTCAVLTGSHGEELLMSFLAGFRVRTSVLPEKAQESTERVAECGNTWRALWATFDRVSSSWKTAQPCLLEDLEECLVTWPRSGMTVAGRCWELPTLALRTGGIGSGLWPTPTVCGNYNRKGASKTSGDGLATAVKFSTPTTRQRTSPSQLNRNTPGLALEVGAIGGTLNPTWVEWLMGWPIGMTELKPLETAKFQSWRQQHSIF